MIKTIRTLGKVLAWAEHPVRNIRCNEKDKRNVPYKRLNTVGNLLVRLTGGWPKEEE